MADNDQPKVRYDDFVSKVQSDPANPQATIMLAGYSGRGPDGHVRIYPDPTLGKWYDVPEADVVHSQPIPNSELGGSYVWIKSSAAIKPGSSAPAPQPQAMAAVAPNLQPTPTAVTLCPDCVPHNTLATVCTQHLCQPTPATHCFICPPLTQAPGCAQPYTQQVHCPTQPVVCDTRTILTQIGCPPQSLHCPSAPVVCDTLHTVATVCTQAGCPTHPLACPVVTNPPVCGIVPPTLVCGAQQQGAPQVNPQAFAAAPQALQPTPSAVHQCGGQPQAFTQHICPTPSAVQHCGQPQFTQHICPTPSAVHQCGQPQFTQHICPTPSAVQHCGGQPQAFTQHICPTPSAVHQCGQPQFTQHICPTPSAVHQCGGVTMNLTHCICPTPTLTANIACLQTANTPCFPVTLAGCTPQSIACTPATIQNGVFTPFGR